MKRLISSFAVLGAVLLMAVPAQASGSGAVSTKLVAASTATTCGPKSATHFPAPGVGHGATYTADSAGSVTLLQPSQTTLDVESVSHNSGWKDTVITESGTRVHVGFQRVGAPQEQERFWARLNSTGTIITIVLQSCT